MAIVNIGKDTLKKLERKKAKFNYRQKDAI